MNAISTSDPDAEPGGSMNPGDPGANAQPAPESRTAPTRAAAPAPGAPPSGHADAAPPPTGGGVSILLQTDDAQPELEGWLAGHLNRAIQLVHEPDALLNIVVVDDPAMIELHQQYHQLNTTTDVLTFDLRSDDDDPVEGDIVICLDEAARQAEQRGHSRDEELLLYAIHGLMHLLGEDDHTDADYQRMHHREDDLLEAMGLSRLFGDTSDASDEPVASNGGDA